MKLSYLFLQIYKSLLITSMTGFDIAFTNVDDKLKQRQDKVVPKLWTPTLYQRCATLKIRRQILVHFERRINVRS